VCLATRVLCPTHPCVCEHLRAAPGSEPWAWLVSILRPREPCHPRATRSRGDGAWVAGLALGTAPRPLTLLKLLGGGGGVPSRGPKGPALQKRPVLKTVFAGRGFRCGRPSPAGGPLQRASREVGRPGWGMRNGPNLGPKTEGKPGAFSCPLPQLTDPENGPGRTEQGWLPSWAGWGGGRGRTTHKIPSPPLAPCQNYFRYPEMGVSGCWVHDGALRGLCPAQGLALGVWPSPGTPRVTSSSNGTYICPKLWARGSTGPPNAPGPSRFSPLC